MKKIYSVILAFLLINTFALQAQERKYCHTDEVYQETLKKHPEILQKQQALDEFCKNFVQNNPGLRRANADGTTSVVYIIPLVFHVIHQYGSENISDAQIIDAVNILNRDYRKLNADTVNIIPDFQAVAADVEIEFRLANIDPNGNCTNGIDRHVSFRTHIADDYAKFNPWPRSMYLNIWTIAEFGPAHATAAAYAYRPGSIPNANVDGIIALSNYVGSIGTSNAGRSRVLTHEIGHVLNLLHTWGFGNQVGVTCGDDGIGDTPITKGWDFCPSSNYDVCTPGINENFQNYMDYSYCDVMFTYDQKAYMLATLNSSVANRNNLWTPANLTATGTDVLPQACAPIADFFPNKDHICAGDSIQFFSAGYNSDTMNYTWSFPTGTPTSSTLENPYVTFATPGAHNATLVVANANGTDTVIKNAVVTASGTPSFTPNYFDDFETAGTFPGIDGYIINSAGNAWQRNTTVGYSGTACIRMLNYNTGQAGLVDSWVMPAINMTGSDTTQLTFRLAYARKDVTKSDRLKVYISDDCGKNWALKRNLAGSQLATTANVPAGFIPTSASQWGLITVSGLYQINGQPNARVKFEFISDGDNNIYIDDINITAIPTGIQEADIAGLNFDVYPNPSSDVIHVTFEMKASGKVEVQIADLLGREIKTVVDDRLNSGVHEYNLSTREFSKGMYLIRLKAGEISTVKKLVVE